MAKEIQVIVDDPGHAMEVKSIQVEAMGPGHEREKQKVN
jgi:hypothetical protein